MSDFKHSPSQAGNQLRDQLSSEKRKLGFFFGAGTSMAVGIPGVFALSKMVEDILTDDYKAAFQKIKTVAKSENIEYALNRLRTIRELIGESDTDEYDGIKGKAFGQELDIKICEAISKVVDTSVVKDMTPHLVFANWLFQNQATRYNPIEFFTTNYDLLVEKSLEAKKIPYFDGFVGTIDPFFIPECVEAENNKDGQMSYIPYTWLRLWKIHGSINWFLTEDSDKRKRIVRCTNRQLATGDELMIYPSKQKYDESRRLPFLVFQDRLRKFLSNGETMLLISGYSFGDEHLNEVLFQALRSNKRFAITALMYGDDVGGKRRIDPKTLNYGLDCPNLSLLGPDKACIGGVIADWDTTEADLSELNYWNDTDKYFNLGDFKTFTDYLQLNFGLLSKGTGTTPAAVPTKAVI